MDHSADPLSNSQRCRLASCYQALAWHQLPVVATWAFCTGDAEHCCTAVKYEAGCRFLVIFSHRVYMHVTCQHSTCFVLCPTCSISTTELLTAVQQYAFMPVQQGLLHAFLLKQTQHLSCRPSASLSSSCSSMLCCDMLLLNCCCTALLPRLHPAAGLICALCPYPLH